MAFAAITGSVGIAVAVITGFIAISVTLYKNNEDFRNLVWNGVKALISGLLKAKRLCFKPLLL